MIKGGNNSPVPPPRTRGRPTNPSVSSGSSVNLTSDRNSLLNAEAALRQVHKNWRSIMEPDFNPVPLALELLDDSSLGKDLVGFEALLNTLNSSVEEVVTDHYRQFSSTTAIFTGIQTELGEGQVQVQEMKKDLIRCKEILKTQRSDLNVLWSKAKQHNEMLRILDMLDEIKLVPDRLEALFRDKYYLTGIRLLIVTIRALDAPELAPIKATAEIRRTLNKLKNTLHEVLIEEIHNHVYLKIHLNEEFEMVAKYLRNDFDEHNLPCGPDLEEDLTADPEADSLNFLRIVVICLKLIGKLSEALLMIKTRVPVELYQLVDKTINEVDARKDKGRGPEELFEGARLNEFGADGCEILSCFVERLYQKFILVLGYHRFVVLLIQNIHVNGKGPSSPFPEIASPSLPNPNPTNLNRRVSRLKLSKEATTPSYNVKEVWGSVQSEIRSILYDYITDPQLQNMAAADAISSINDSMRGREVRDLKKQLFKFTDTGDIFDDISPNIMDIYDHPPLTEIPEIKSGNNLYESVRQRVEASAGSDSSKRLFNLTTQDSPFQIPNESERTSRGTRAALSAQATALTINLASIAVDKYSFSSSLSTEHRLLIAPNIYTISVLFPHTVLFFERAQSLLQFTEEDDVKLDSEGFLRDFFSTTFLPQMELKARQHLALATTGSHAFQISTKHTSPQDRPLLNCVSELNSLMGNLCTTLQSLPFQREEYLRFIETVLEAFLEKCRACYKVTVASSSGQADEEPSGGAIVSSIWAQSKEMLGLFQNHPYILNRSAEPKALADLNEKEMEVQIQLKQKRSLHTSELLFDNKKLSLLATLSHSMKWFVTQIRNMIGGPEPLPLATEAVPSLISTSDLGFKDRAPSIRLSSDFTGHLEQLLENFGKLADLGLYTLRIEFRCHTMYYLDLAVREGTYYISHDTPIIPDSYVTTLNSDLAICEESLRNHLPPEDLNFVFDQLASFMSRVLISSDNVRNIGKMSQRGLEKMHLNIAALQQNLTNLSFFGNKGLAHARAFYSLYDLDLESFAERAQAQGLLFSHAEYKSLLDLTLETLHYETTLNTTSASSSVLESKVNIKQDKEKSEDRQINDLIIQSYHEQLMALREFTSKFDE